MNTSDVEPRATIGDEHVDRAALVDELLASLKVVDQYGSCGWMEGHETGSTELGRPDGNRDRHHRPSDRALQRCADL